MMATTFLKEDNIYSPFIKEHLASILKAGILVILSSAVFLPIPYFLKLVVDRAIPRKDVGLLVLLLVASLSIYLLKCVIFIIKGKQLAFISGEFMKELRLRYVSHVMNLPERYFDNNSTGTVFSNFNMLGLLSRVFSESFLSAPASLIELALSILILIKIDQRLTLICILLLPAYYLQTRHSYNRARSSSESLLESERTLTRSLYDLAITIQNVRVFSNEQYENHRITRLVEDARIAGNKEAFVYKFAGEKVDLLGNAIQAILLFISALLIIYYHMSVGSYLAFSAYMIRLLNPAQTAAALSYSLQPIIGAYNKIKQFLDLEEREESSKETVVFKGNIRLSNVSFKYDNKKILYNARTYIKSGDRVLIMGPNGAGKTTLIKLIMGFYNPDEGLIYIDDKRMIDLDASNLRKQMSVVSQTNILLNRSIKENIAYSRLEASDEEIVVAARLVGLEDAINSMPNGYDTQIGELGRRLSGGERQKIAMARAILRRAKLVIFDEIYKNLDEASKKKITDLLMTQFVGTTCIIISHEDVPNVPFDKKLVIDNGIIREVNNGSESVQEGL